MTEDAIDAALNTLQFLQYTYHGGDHWKPPLGPKPVFSIYDWNKDYGVVFDITDKQLTEIYEAANGQTKGKSHPITTASIFKAMRAMLSVRLKKDTT